MSLVLIWYSILGTPSLGRLPSVMDCAFLIGLCSDGICLGFFILLVTWVLLGHCRLQPMRTDTSFTSLLDAAMVA